MGIFPAPLHSQHPQTPPYDHNIICCYRASARDPITHYSNINYFSIDHNELSVAVVHHFYANIMAV